jgi:hypothetical protein
MASTRSRAIDFTIERQRHAGFVGRAELLGRLDELLIADRTDRRVVVTGGPGMGKSAVLAAWLARREAAGDVVPHHFIRRGWANWDDPETLVGSLVAQIEARFVEPREPEADEQLAPACTVTPDSRHVVSASWDQTLKVWELASGREVATLQGHTGRVMACAVTPDGRHVVSASDDRTLKVWDLVTYTCHLTHCGDSAYEAVAVTATTVIAGDETDGVWSFDVPWSKNPQCDAHDGATRSTGPPPPPTARSLYQGHP